MILSVFFMILFCFSLTLLINEYCYVSGLSFTHSCSGFTIFILFIALFDNKKSNYVENYFRHNYYLVFSIELNN